MEIINTAPLSTTGCKQFQGMAFDGCRFYLTDRYSPRIFVLDTQLELECCVDTCRQYTCICYDRSQCCFWAAAEGCFGHLFCLDQHLQEIDKLSLAPFYGCITGVSHCCAADCLLVSTSSEVLRADKCAREQPQTIYTCKQAFITGVCCVSPCYLCHQLQDGKQKLFVSCGSQATTQPLDIPDDLLLKACVFACENQDCYLFYLLAARHGYPCLLECAVEKEALGPICCCNDFSRGCDMHKQERCGCRCTPPQEHNQKPNPPQGGCAGHEQDSTGFSHPLLAFALAAAEQAARRAWGIHNEQTQDCEESPDHTDGPHTEEDCGCCRPTDFPTFLYRQPIIYPVDEEETEDNEF